MFAMIFLAICWLATCSQIDATYNPWMYQRVSRQFPFGGLYFSSGGNYPSMSPGWGQWTYQQPQLPMKPVYSMKPMPVWSAPMVPMGQPWCPAPSGKCISKSKTTCSKDSDCEKGDKCCWDYCESRNGYWSGGICKDIDTSAGTDAGNGSGDWPPTPNMMTGPGD